MSAIEQLPEEVAYNQVLRNLRTMTGFAGWGNFLESHYPDRCFYYGEGGYVLVLPHGLVWTSTENGDYIHQAESVVINNRWLEPGTKLKYLSGKLPREAISDALSASSAVKNQWEDFKKQALVQQ